MYTFSSKLRIAAIVLMVVGLLGIVYGFFTGPSTVDDVKKIEAAQMEAHHGGGHAVVSHEAHGEKKELHGEEAHASHDKHYEHILTQYQNKPWAALYVAAFFFMMISLGVLAFYAIQRAAQAGWSPVLFRVMEGITSYLLPGAVLLVIIFVLANMGESHMFIWTDKAHVEHDELLKGKSGYLNMTSFLIRAVVYIAGWVTYRQFSRKFSIAQDTAEDDRYFIKNFRISAGFLVFFLVTESMMSWDWVMSVEPHWFSTLFAWYVFASMFVSGITVIAMVTIYLKSKGYLEYVNNSHIHDLAKFMFGISVFWTYLWFSQFLLYWYSNIPEEVTYFVERIQDFRLPFFGMVVMNFVFPLLVLMNSDYKRMNWFVIMTGIVILCGHYLDIFNMIMPGSVGDKWFIGVSEISSILFFLGLFILVVFTTLTKVPLLAKRNPFIEESKHFHY